MQYQQIIYSLIYSFILSVIFGIVLIPFLKRLKFGQNVREEGPKRHLKKSGTPTIGGIIMLLSILIVGAYFAHGSRLIYAAIFLTLSCGVIGFIDDYLNIILKRSLGLTPMQKMLGLIFISVVFTIFIYNFTDIGSKVIIPFANGIQVDLKALYILFTVFVILCATNSVNLTDGLDGLAAGTTSIVAIYFIIASLILGNLQMAIFSAIIAGSCLGFLIFNAHPAKVFMGDTGSLALGGAISAVAIILKMPLFLVLVGGIFVIEALSVIIQVFYYQTYGKRIFRMSPIHHHFELCGWRETKVVTIFWSVTGALCIIGLLALM